MNMTDRKIVLLRGARKRIANESACYICTALMNETQEKTKAYRYDNPKCVAWCRAEQQLTDYIETAIRPYTSLELWLYKQHSVESPWDNKPKMRRTRLAWIDWMIKQLEAKR